MGGACDNDDSADDSSDDSSDSPGSDDDVEIMNTNLSDISDDEDDDSDNYEPPEDEEEMIMTIIPSSVFCHPYHHLVQTTILILHLLQLRKRQLNQRKRNHWG